MPETDSDLREQLDRLLQSSLDRGTLRRELETLARERAFRDLAPIWAPALYARDAQFFETFLLRYLDGSRHAEVIRALLPQAEAAEHDALFQGLYGKLLGATTDWQAAQREWNKEILALAQSSEADERVLRAVQRREMRRAWWLMLTEETALALYGRGPALFHEFIRGHVQRGWGRERRSFTQLREAVRAQGDDELSWFLFRRFGDEREWKEELGRLLRQDLPAAQISDELQKRHPEYFWDIDATPLVDFLEKYGAAILPYVENNLHWIKRRAEGRLLRAVERLGDETLYWRIFFKVGNPALWNEALRGLLKKPLSNEAFQFELERRTPPEQRWSWWGLEPDVAVEIYRRDRALFRPFLERFVRQPEAKLFAEAERAQDEEFLDFLSFQLLHRSSWLAYRAFPPRHARSWWKADEKSKEELDEISRLLVGRFDRLYAQSPETYVRHAANILSRFRAFEVWKFRHDRTYNPAFAYLLDRRREAWHHSPEGVRELLESPNIYVQIIGLEILREGGREAAQRALENLLMLRALLLGRARRGTKRLALECLERAARQGAPFAGRILPVLEEAMDLHGKRAIDERIMVSFVRVRRHQQGTEGTLGIQRNLVPSVP